MSEDARHQLGVTGEQLAVEHLERCGYSVLERNYRTRWGELDVIAFDGLTLVFCEVKTRRMNGAAGSPFEAVHGTKQRRIRRIAARWLIERSGRPRAQELRFDAIGITFDDRGRLVALEHLEGAF
ncbi:MAG: YraN family protein [Solirubrobacteraceae bacterium]